jgi:hypothetical protein
MQRRLSVVGSYRSQELHIYNFINENVFKRISAGVGEWVQQQGHILRVGWSNDHLLIQARPEEDGRQKVTPNGDGTLEADPEHCRFLFSHTADYHAMGGFLDAAARRRTAGYIELDISDAMLFGARERSTIAWPPINDQVIGGATVANHIENGIIKRKSISGRRDDELLRSKYLIGMITADGEEEVDLVIGVGGGKASGLIYHTALERLKLLPLPYCGGEAQRILLHAYARRNSRAWERIAYVFGHEVPETSKGYAENEVPDLLKVLSNVDNFFCYPYRVFVALPYGRTPEEQKRQDELFKLIERSIVRACGDGPQRYPGASAVRIDQHIVGTKEIHTEMWTLIRNCGVIMGELTPLHADGAPNANVYYELGFADGANHNKPQLLTVRRNVNVPFDLGNRKLYPWSDLEDLERICAEQIALIFENVRTGHP